MIIDALISLPLSLLSLAIGLLPAYSGFPVGLSSALSTLTSFTVQLGDILPMTTFWDIILLTIVIELGITAFNTIAWLFHWKQAK